MVTPCEYSVKKEVGNFFSAPSQNLSRRFRELARIIQEKSAKIRVIRGKKSLGKRSQTSKNFLYGVLKHVSTRFDNPSCNEFVVSS